MQSILLLFNFKLSFAHLNDKKVLCFAGIFKAKQYISPVFKTIAG